MKNSVRVAIDMSEELPHSRIVGDLNKLTTEALARMDNTLTYTINSPTKMKFELLEPNNLFYIDSLNPDRSLLRLKARVDREATDCRTVSDCCQPLTFPASGTENTNALYNSHNNDLTSCGFILLLMVDLSGEESKEPRQLVVQLEIRVLDINDNAPSWQPHAPNVVDIRSVNDTIVFKNERGYHSLITKIPKLDLNIAEHTPIGTRLALPPATDPDAEPDNVTARYGIHSQSVPNAFVLDWDRQAPKEQFSVGKTKLWLRLNRNISHDQHSTHNVVLYATDAGREKELTGYLLLNITVADINDHPPTFSKKTDEVWIRENIPIRTKIYQAIARDPDSSDQNRLTFGFLPSVMASTQRLFNLDKSTGIITTKGIIDFEDAAAHQISIFVSDGKWTDQMELLVIVENVNDHAPEIHLHSHLATSKTSFGQRRHELPYAQLTIVVPENGPADQLVATATVTDKDRIGELRAKTTLESLRVTGRYTKSNSMLHHGEIECTADSDRFRMTTLQLPNNKQMADKTRFKITIGGRPLDREQQANLLLTIECYDGSGTTNVTPNTRTYGAQTLLYTAPSSTIVRRTATAIMQVVISDENDSPPVFHGPQTANIVEGKPSGTVITKLQAVDADDPHTLAGNAGIRYYIAGSADVTWASGSNKDNPDPSISLPQQPWFRLNSISGELTSLITFDRELISSMRVPLRITDGGDMTTNDLQMNPNTGYNSSAAQVNSINASVIVVIQDINDCTPTFSQQRYEFNVSENARNSFLVGNVSVTDCDVDEANSVWDLWLQMGHLPTQPQQQQRSDKSDTSKPTVRRISQSHNINTKVAFTIAKSGTISVRSPYVGSFQPSPSHQSPVPYSQPICILDREESDLILLMVYARDRGSPSLTGSAQIFIHVHDVNDNIPEWQFPRPQQRDVNLSVDAAAGHKVTQVGHAPLLVTM